MLLARKEGVFGSHTNVIAKKERPPPGPGRTLLQRAADPVTHAVTIHHLTNREARLCTCGRELHTAPIKHHLHVNQQQPRAREAFQELVPQRITKARLLDKGPADV